MPSRIPAILPVRVSPMKRCLLLAVMLLCILPLAGCFVFSEHPLYTPDERTFDPSLLGTWASNDEDCRTATITGNNPPCSFVFSQQEMDKQKGYRIVVTDERGKRNTFRARLVELNKARFLDAVPLEAPDLKAPIKNVHSFWKVVRHGSTLKLVPLNLDWMQKQLKSRQVTLSHRSEEALLLTASTAELRSFIASHATVAQAWPEADASLLVKRK